MKTPRFESVQQSPKGKSTVDATMSNKSMPVKDTVPPSGGKQHKPGSDVQKMPQSPSEGRSKNLDRVITRQSEEEALHKKMASDGLGYLKGMHGTGHDIATEGHNKTLTYGRRKQMASKQFALPGKRKGGKGGYPMNNPAHARNALSRVAQFGNSAEQAKVRAKVHSKFPNIGEKGQR